MLRSEARLSSPMHHIPSREPRLGSSRYDVLPGCHAHEARCLAGAVRESRLWQLDIEAPRSFARTDIVLPLLQSTVIGSTETVRAGTAR
nr:hypothetical protein CFP56_33428 [Quercus suber]